MKPSTLIILAVAATTLFCCKKSNDEIISSTQAKPGVANRRYLLFERKETHQYHDSTGYHYVVTKIALNDTIALQIDSSAKTAYYAPDLFHSSDSSLNNYYSTISKGNPQIIRQEMRLKDDSIFINQTYLVGNISQGVGYAGYKLP